MKGKSIDQGIHGIQEVDGSGLLDKLCQSF